MTEQEQNRAGESGYDEDDFLHLGAVLLDYLRVLQHGWLLLILLLAAGVAVSCGFLYLTYKPVYRAAAFYSVERTMSVYTDSEVVARIAESVPILTSTSDFREEIRDYLQIPEGETAPSYSFRADATPSANLFNVSVICYDESVTNELIKAFEAIYPSWVNKSIGKCILTLMDEQFSDGQPVSQRNWLMYGLIGAGIGFLLWFLGATIRILSVRRVHSATDLNTAADLKCYGELPEVNVDNNLSDIRRRLLLSSDRVSGAYQRGVLELRTDLEEQIKNMDHPVILVTSTLPQEGKSLVTLNLALAFAERDKKVLVIDGDLRYSGISRITQTDNKVQKGISDYICRKERDILMQWENLAILPVGTVTEEALQNFDRDLFGNMIRQLKETADIVFVDTPPASYFGDALDYSEFADLLLYVVRGDYAEVKLIRKHSEPFADSGRPCGYILNRMQHDSFGYGYGYGRYGYGRYGYGRYGYGRYGYGKYGYNKYGYGDEDEDRKRHGRSHGNGKEKQDGSL